MEKEMVMMKKGTIMRIMMWKEVEKKIMMMKMVRKLQLLNRN